MKNVLRTTLAALTIAVVALPAVAGAQQVQAAPAQPKTMKHMSEDHAASGWKELDAFHTVMAATWHPASKSNDLKPIREKAIALSDAAQTWAAAKVPAACDKKELRDAITAVASQSKSLAELVAKKGSDADVKKALSDLHTKFEVVEHGCHLQHKG